MTVQLFIEIILLFRKISDAIHNSVSTSYKGARQQNTPKMKKLILNRSFTGNEPDK